MFQLDRQELQAALLLYMKSLARVIPTVVAHELEDMGRLIDIDSEQVQEEIVSVVDEVSPPFMCVSVTLKPAFHVCIGNAEVRLSCVPVTLESVFLEYR